MLILVKIYGKYWFPSKCFENLGIGRNFWKILILAKTFENLYFCQKFRKLYQILSKFLMIPDVVKISDSLDFVQNFMKNHDFPKM